MVSHLFFYQLMVLGLLWLCVMLHYAWPNECTGGNQKPSKPLPPLRRFCQLVDHPVAYLLHADNVSRPLPFRLHCVNQPVISTPNVFSTPRPILLACTWAHLGRSTL